VLHVFTSYVTLKARNRTFAVSQSWTGEIKLAHVPQSRSPLQIMEDILNLCQFFIAPSIPLGLMKLMGLRQSFGVVVLNAV